VACAVKQVLAQRPVDGAFMMTIACRGCREWVKREGKGEKKMRWESHMCVAVFEPTGWRCALEVYCHVRLPGS